MLIAMGRKTDPLLAVNGPILTSPAQRSACQTIRARLRADDARRMRDRLAYYLGKFLIGTEEEVNMELAKIVAKALSQALEQYEKLDNNKREWLRVGIEYFVLEDDGTPDADDIGGLADDAVVVSSTLEHCGFHDLAKSIRDYLA